MHLGMLASDEDEELMVATVGLKVAIPHCRQDNSLLRDLPMESSFMGQSISS